MPVSIHCPHGWEGKQDDITEPEDLYRSLFLSASDLEGLRATMYRVSIFYPSSHPEKDFLFLLLPVHGWTSMNTEPTSPTI